MTSPFTYDFGYSWSVVWGPLVPLVLFAALAGVGLWLSWRRWLVLTLTVPAAWAAFSLVSLHAFGINAPQRLPTDRFLASGTGRVVDVGAGSGRAAVGLLLARPRVTVTGVDIYSGYYGIDDNTPERFMLNARTAGVADRANAVVGDARELPLAAGEYDGVISSYAIDHITRDGIPKALSEANRVLKPGGEFLLMIVQRRLVGAADIATHGPPPAGGRPPLADDARSGGVRGCGAGDETNDDVFSLPEVAVLAEGTDPDKSTH